MKVHLHSVDVKVLFQEKIDRSRALILRLTRAMAILFNCSYARAAVKSYIRLSLCLRVTFYPRRPRMNGAQNSGSFSSSQRTNRPQTRNWPVLRLQLLRHQLLTGIVPGCWKLLIGGGKREALLVKSGLVISSQQNGQGYPDYNSCPTTFMTVMPAQNSAQLFTKLSPSSPRSNQKIRGHFLLRC